MYPGKYDGDRIFAYSTLTFMFSVFFAPITEEIIYRLWAYGKNLQLQFSFFVTFVLYLLSYIIQDFVFDYNSLIPKYFPGNSININNILTVVVKNCVLILIGLIIYLVLKSTSFTIPTFFTSLTQSQYTFYFIILSFAFLHLYQTKLVTNHILDYIFYFVGSYIITRHARDYGIFYAILIHIANNAISVFAGAVEARTVSKNAITNESLIQYLLIATIFVVIYLAIFLKAKPRTISPA